MDKNEIALLRRLCNFKKERFGRQETELLEYATPEVLGQLFFNRMQGVAYGVLKGAEQLNKVNREFRNSLKTAYEQNIQKNKSFFKCVHYITDLLSKCTFKYALLKGAALCETYPAGYRTSNDIDILIDAADIPHIEEILYSAGFRQGYIRNGEFAAASRKMIIESRLMRGETVPFIKKISLPGMEFLEADINFSLDYKPGDGTLIKKMLEDTAPLSAGETKINTLSGEDFFIHLCMHLYKEATTFFWITLKRDMTLYKYCDIYMFLNQMGREETDKLFKRIAELGLEKICAFAILYTASFFTVNNDLAVKKAEEIFVDDRDFLHTVADPGQKRKLIYKNKNIAERFFLDDRTKNLMEVH